MLKRAFTIVDLLVVLAVIGILVALLLPAVQLARETARRAACQNNLRQLAIALHSYHDRHRLFPPGTQLADYRSSTVSKSYSWQTMILPDLEQRSLYNGFDFAIDCQDQAHRHLTRTQLPVFLCPSDPASGNSIMVRSGAMAGSWGGNNYHGISGTNALTQGFSAEECAKQDPLSQSKYRIHSGMFYENSSVCLDDLIDGTSQTLMAGERGIVEEWGRWAGPGVAPFCPWGLADVVLPGAINHPEWKGGIRRKAGSVSDRLFFWSYHPNASVFTLADGSVRILSPEIDAILFQALCTRAGHEPVGEF